MSSKLLLKRPLVTQCTTSAILFASGDIVAQQVIEHKWEKHDVSHQTSSIFILLHRHSNQFLRTARLTLYGGDPWRMYPPCLRHL